MNFEELTTELTRLFRNALYNAETEELVSAAYKGRYLEGLSKPQGEPQPTKEQYQRSMELYDFYIGSQHRARDWQKKADLYNATLTLLFKLPEALR